MASRTGLMPITVKTEDRFTKVGSNGINNNKKVRKSLVQGNSNKIRHQKASILPSTNQRQSQNIRKSQSPARNPLSGAGTKSRFSVAGPSASLNSRKSVSSTRKSSGPFSSTAKPASSSIGRGKQISTHSAAVQKRKSHPGFTKQDGQRYACTPNRKSLATEKRSPKSILKKETCTGDSKMILKKPVVKNEIPQGRHVQFKTKATDQASLRAKLNDWLKSRGKTPSRCRHLMCFDEEMSAKKKSQKLVDRTITQNLLANQDKALQNEEVRKKLFDDTHPPKTKENSGDKENYCETLASDGKELMIKENEAPHSDQTGSVNTKLLDYTARPSPIPDVSSSNQNIIGDEAIFNNLKTMLDECLTLFHAGCPLENILPWLKEIEMHIPRALTFAPYYICKAKVMGSSPQMVLEVFCEAVRNNAQPSDLLASEMKAAFSQLLPTQLVENSNVSLFFEPSPTPSVPIHPVNYSEPQSYDTESSAPGPDYSTPAKSTNTNLPALNNGGSTIKYNITTTTPLLRHTPEPSPLAVVTPVRRSTRLSNRQSTPGTGLRREINSVSDLSSAERRTMLFRNNTALTGE